MLKVLVLVSVSCGMVAAAGVVSPKVTLDHEAPEQSYEEAMSALCDAPAAAVGRDDRERLKNAAIVADGAVSHPQARIVLTSLAGEAAADQARTLRVNLSHTNLSPCLLADLLDPTSPDR